jgi:hypothetical protein
MGRSNVNNIELYMATDRLLEHGGRTAQRLSDRGYVSLATALRGQLSSLVAGLAMGQRKELLWILQCLEFTLDMAFKRLGIWGDLVSAFAALERVEHRVWFPEERDGPPTVVRDAPDDETQAPSWSMDGSTGVRTGGVRIGADDVTVVR